MPNRITISAQQAAAMRERRRSSGLSTRAVGDRVGMTDSWVSAIERGVGHTVDREQLRDWLELIDMDPAEHGFVFDDDGPEWKLPAEFNWVPRQERAAAERFLAWVFQMRQVHQR